MTLAPPTSARTRGDVLVTGATGFLGMELMARLLQDRNRRVWALVRASSQAEAETRVRGTLASLVRDPEAVAGRVVPVAGDITRDGLSLEPRVRDELAEAVDEVIHSAASVSFSLPLEQARAVNVEGTRRMLELALLASARGDGLRRFAHVSTAYVAGTHRGSFGEEDFARGQGFNNSYERSKWEAEGLVRRFAGLLPVQVFRPSIVVGDERSGWTASFNVIYSPLRAYARGALPAIPARRSAPVDAVPVDYVARSILALAGAGAGRTWQLAAATRANTVGELIDLAGELLGQPRARALPPALYKAAVHPLLMRRAGPAQRRWLERGEVFFPYFATRARFDTSATRAALEEAGVGPVPPLVSYLDRLLDFAARADWGKRHVPRSTVALHGAGGVDEREVDSGPDPGPERTYRDRDRGEQRPGPGHGPGAGERRRARGTGLPQHAEG
ncbi:MAG TPA: SDR family oxidoreductase [Thermoleophilaceae bacterium]|nr:SDR family oxidoreductase [Thermoleophilaceae bacterium]